MSDDLVSEEDLERAREDPAFRQKLMTKNLDKLLAVLTKARAERSRDPAVARQMREGVDLAVLLADRIQRDDDGSGPQAA